jgi:radical SAM protein with 4Fe4S-binding SPASM domain
MQLNVFLGYACNFKCGYCLQSPEAATAVRKKGDAAVFVERVIPVLVDRPIDRLSYWGGEPLLYWQAIKTIQTGLFQAGTPVRKVRLTSNGSLLTPRIVAEINAMGLHTVISDHGAFGGPDWQQVGHLQRFSLHFLFTHQSLEVWPWFERILGLEDRIGRRIFPHIGWVRATPGCPEDYWLTHADLTIHLSHLRDLARLRLEGDRLAHDALEGPYREWRRAMTGEVRPLQPLCHATDHVSVDLEGNRYACHHSVQSNLRTGHVCQTRPATPAKAAALRQVRRFVDTAECRRCPINRWCRGNCHRSQSHDVDCRLAKAKHDLFLWIAEREGEPIADLHHHPAGTGWLDRAAPL